MRGVELAQSVLRRSNVFKLCWYQKRKQIDSKALPVRSSTIILYIPQLNVLKLIKK